MTWLRLPRPGVVLALAAALAVLASCAAATQEPDAIPGSAQSVDAPFAGGYPMYADAESHLQVIFGTPDIAVGEPRVAFALFDEDGLISHPDVTVRTFFFPNGPDADREGPVAEASLRFGAFPLGGRGLYRGELPFDRAGLWAIEATVPRGDGSSETVLFPVTVAEEPRAPHIGEAVPASQHRTLSDGVPIEELTTSWAPDEVLYRETIAEALAAGRPFVVVFASPAFCTTALCGPQVELAGELAAEYQDRASFIHIDLYENPHEIRGDLDRAVRSPLLEEWRITTDQWTFVVGGGGRVIARFEGFTPRDELEPALLRAIEAS